MTEATDRVTEGNDRIDELQRRPFPSYSKYRDSGVEWLGKIPAHWNPKPFKASLVRNDSGVWGEDFDADGTIVLRSTDQTKRGAWRITEPAQRRLSAREATYAKLLLGDLLVAKSSGSTHHIGKTSVVDEAIAALNCCYSNFMQRLRVSAEHLPRFFWYLMNCPVAREQLIFLSSTTTGLGNLNGSILGAILLPMAPSDEQRAIVKFLDRETERIDALVARKERLIELLQEKRSALITRAITRGLDPNVPMKDSGIEWLGQTPAHWDVKQLKHVLRASKDSIKTGPFGSQLKSSEMQAGEIKVYNQRSVIDRDFSSGENYVSLEKFAELRAFVVLPGDLLITTQGSIGRCAILPDGAERGVLHPCLMRVRPDRRRILTRFLEIQIEECSIVLDQLRFMSNATTIDVIYSDSLREVWLNIPPVKEQTSTITFLAHEKARVDTLIAKVRQAIVHLKEFRTALISAAVTGKIDIRKETA